MSGTVIKNCKCTNKYQDAKYGEGKRVHNQAKKEGVSSCTSCGARK